MYYQLPDALLLDLDDTILSFSSHAESCWQAVCRRFAGKFNGLDDNRLYDTIKETRKWFWSDPVRHRENRQDMRRAHTEVVMEALRRLGMENAGLAAGLAGAFEQERTDQIRPFPGAIETLAALRERGVRLALITNGGAELQRQKVDRFRLAPFFQTVLIEGELGFGKPDERVYRTALEQLSARPEHAWIVGDNLEWEVAVPQQIGLFALWHDLAGKGLPPDPATMPDRIIRSLRELVA